MRNLKKILALALALVMTLSVMSVASAKNVEYADSASVNSTYATAVDVLSGMKVLTGDEGGFRPKDSITRAEMTAVIYRIVTGDVTNFQHDIFAGYGNFTDVPANAWYAGYLGFCANGKLVQGDGKGIFRPKDAVTGYEVLAMLLRAIGYDQNGEFSSTDWKIKVATLAQSLGILRNVSVSQLVGPASRELVAELIFRGIAYVPTVTYTALGSYSTTSDALGWGLTNDTLGYRNFGLTNSTGVVVGNQATGENSTLLGLDMTAANYIDRDNSGTYNSGDTLLSAPSSYTYGNGTAFAIDTGLDMFGHSMEVWFNAKSGPARTVYASYDRATLVATVSASTYDIAANNPATPGELPDAAAAAGFSVNASSTAHWSEVYDEIDAAAAAAASAAAPSTMYVLISNNRNKTVDVAISLDIEVALIEKINTTASPNTVTLDDSTFGTVTGGDGVINVPSLTPSSVKTLGTTVMATKVTGTSAGNINLPFYDLAAVGTKRATVVAVNNNNGTIQLSDGTTIDRSPLVAASQVKSGTSTPAPWVNTVYNIVLDMNGKWLGATPVGNNSFLYGTYADYSSVTSSGTVNYYMTGVNLNGEIVTVPVTHHTADGSTFTTLDTPSTGYDALAVEKKTWSANNKDTTGVNTGYALYSTGILSTAAGDLTNVGVSVESSTDFTITSAEVAVGYTAENSNAVFMTNNTKFIVVTGTGTDTLKVATYNGIADLLGNASSVNINNDTLAMYYTSSPYIYNHATDIKSVHADVVVVDSDALEYSYTSNVYFCDDATVTGMTSTTTIGGTLTPVTQYWLYNNGVGGWYYLTGAPSTDEFCNLTQVGTTNTVSQEPVYTASDNNNHIENKTYYYVGATNNLDTALIDTTLYTVTGANVVNLADPTMALGSIAELNAAVSHGYTVTVYAVIGAPGTVTDIYVTSCT